VLSEKPKFRVLRRPLGAHFPAPLLVKEHANSDVRFHAGLSFWLSEMSARRLFTSLFGKLNDDEPFLLSLPTEAAAMRMKLAASFVKPLANN